MTRDIDQDRLDRLRGELADLRARADAMLPAAPPVPTAAPQVPPAAHEVPPVAAPQTTVDPPRATLDPPSPRAAEITTAEITTAEITTAEIATATGLPTASAGATSRPAQTTAEIPRGRFGRRRIPRPPRRSPFRPRAKRPPQRLAVPTPIPVDRRSAYLAPPLFPVVTPLAALVIALVLIPVVGQLAFRLWTAMTETSVLLGADGSRLDALRAAAGVAGGGITTALAVAALGVVRGRPGYLGGALAVLVAFVAFPYMAYTANAGIVSAPFPSLAQMITPEGWERGAELQAVFYLAAIALVAALGDLAWRSGEALAGGVRQARRDRDG